MSLIVIVGLGNPGAEYRQTRHNAGFLVVDRLSEELRAPLSRRRFRSACGEGRHDGKRILLLQPRTYMNLSGEAVRDAVAFHRLPLSDLLVISDDVNLPLGRIRIRAGGSHGGQKGLKSIIEALGTEEFPRLRVGVGAPLGQKGMTDHVLGSWGRDELPEVKRQIERAVEAVLCFVEEGVEAAMNDYNAV